MDKELRKIPLFVKAEEIYILVDKLSQLIEKSDNKKDLENIILNDFKNSLNKSALVIPGKIAGAYKEDMLYDIKMQNAAIIRSEAYAILSSISGLEMCGFKEHDYLDLIRNEIDAFRILFAEWVQTFDESNYEIDRWGLFNPPGIHYDDFDIDDELPYVDPFDDEDYDPPRNDFDDFDINDDFNNGFDDED